MCLDYDYLGSRSDGGYAEYCLLPSQWHFIQSEDPESDLASLSLMEPCTVAQHTLRKSGLTAGNSLLIFGAGPIGIMTARWARIFGAISIMLVDILDEKVKFAAERGEYVVNSRSVDVDAEFRKLNGGRPPDVCVEGTGTGKALGQAIDCIRTFGTIAVMGNPHQDTLITLSQHSNLLRKELSLQGVWNSHYAATPINEWEYTMKMFNHGRMKVLDLITHKTDLDGLKTLCEDIYANRINICKAIFSTEA